jgi:hypothetical protein
MRPSEGTPRYASSEQPHTPHPVRNGGFFMPDGSRLNFNTPSGDRNLITVKAHNKPGSDLGEMESNIWYTSMARPFAWL